MRSKIIMMIGTAAMLSLTTTSFGADYTAIEQELKQSLAVEPTKDNQIDRAIRQEYYMSTVGWIEGNMDVSLAFYAKDAHIFDAIGGGEETYDSVYQKDKELRSMVQTMIRFPFHDMKIRVLGDNVAYARFFQEFAFTLKDGKTVDFIGRGTDLWLRRNGRWQVVDEHFSVPVDFKTGLANWLSKPASGYQ